jgi:hypothetical protein
MQTAPLPAMTGTAGNPAKVMDGVDLYRNAVRVRPAKKNKTETSEHPKKEKFRSRSRVGRISE